MNELALFAGAGGGLLATKHLLGWRTVCYVENGAYPVRVLRARIRDGLLDDAPIWGDARTFDGRPWRGCVDIVTAGFPCQPFSQAGKQLGERDERNLWPSTIRIIREVRSPYVLLENVPRLLANEYFGRILGDLAESGYDARWDCIPAAAIGANHQRDRLWILATHTDSTELRVESGRSCWAGREDSPQPRDDGPTQALAHAHRGRLKEHSQLNSQAQQDPANWGPQGRYVGGCDNEVADSDKERLAERKAEGIISDMESTERSGWWAIEPGLGRVVDGMAHRVDRLKALGEGQVPAVVAVVWHLLSRF